MIARLLRRLRLIRYYSATRRRTAWSRALDALLVVTFFLAPVAAWLSSLPERHEVTGVVSGYVTRPYSKSTLVAVSSQATGATQVPGIPHSEFVVTASRMRRGWPLVLESLPQALRITLRRLPDETAFRNAHPVTDASLIAAIELELDRLANVPGEAGAGEAVASRAGIFDWILATGSWWILLFGATSLALGVVHLTWWVATSSGRSRRDRLLRAGRCPSCGYDVRASVFSERCPECGALLS